jgi:hypothetical protein
MRHTTKGWTSARRTGTAIAALALAVGAAACNRSPAAQSAPGSDLARDLQAAGAGDTSSLALAPQARGTDVISAVEQSPEARRAPRPSSAAPRVVHRAQHHVTAPVIETHVTHTAAVAAPAPAPTTVDAPLPQSTQPRPQPAQEQRHGRYKTEAEVFRNAPFPILP